MKRSLSAYSDNRLPAREWREVSAHLADCRHCAAELEQLLRMREALRRLPVLAPPSSLTTSLRILASKQLAHRLEAGFGNTMGRWAARVRMWAEDMMRPIALPMAGGLVSSVVLFAVLVPQVLSRTPSNIRDVPTPLSTEVTFASMGPFGLTDGDDFVVILTVNPQGRMVDYSTPTGQNWVKNPQARRSVENALIFTVFNPGSAFGQPISGKVRLTFRRSQIDVTG